MSAILSQGHGRLTVPHCIRLPHSLTCKADRQPPFRGLPASRIPRAVPHNPRHRARRLRRSLHRRTCKLHFYGPTAPLPVCMPSRNEGTESTPARGVPLSSPDDPRIPVEPPFFFLAWTLPSLFKLYCS